MTDVIPHKDLPRYDMFTDRQLAQVLREYEVELDTDDRCKGRTRNLVKQNVRAIQAEQRQRKRMK